MAALHRLEQDADIHAFRHDKRLAREPAQIQPLMRIFMEMMQEVLHVQEADDMVFILAADRIAREPPLDDGLHRLLHAVFEVYADHIRTRHHDFPRIQVGKVKDIVHEVGFRLVDEALTAALLHEQANLLLGVRISVRLAVDIDTEQVFRHEIRRLVHEPDDGIRQTLDDDERQGDREHDSLVALESQCLRCELAKYDMTACDERESDRQRQRMSYDIIETEPPRHGQYELRHGRLTNPA